MSSTNLEVVQKYQGYEFVIGERLRNLPKDVINYLTDRSNYISINLYELNLNSGIYQLIINTEMNIIQKHIIFIK